MQRGWRFNLDVVVRGVKSRIFHIRVPHVKLLSYSGVRSSRSISISNSWGKVALHVFLVPTDHARLLMFFRIEFSQSSPDPQSCVTLNISLFVVPFFHYCLSQLSPDILIFYLSILRVLQTKLYKFHSWGLKKFYLMQKSADFDEFLHLAFLTLCFMFSWAPVEKLWKDWENSYSSG